MARRGMVMCRSCGHFVEVLQRGEDWELMEDRCPECGGTEFKENDTGEVIRTGE